jgi:hypothetical protein
MLAYFHHTGHTLHFIAFQPGSGTEQKDQNHRHEIHNITGIYYATAHGPVMFDNPERNQCFTCFAHGKQCTELFKSITHEKDLKKLPGEKKHQIISKEEQNMPMAA